MKNNLKLNMLAKAKLEKKELRNTLGGYDLPTVCCAPCGCKYAGKKESVDDGMYGGSSTSANHDANGSNVQDK